MKKIFAIILTAAMLMSLVAGCGEEDPTPTTPKSGISVEEVLQNFEKKLEPLSDDFQLTGHRVTELDDGSFCQWTEVAFKYMTLEDHYQIYLYYDTPENMDRVIMTAEPGTYSDLNFAVLSLYLYESLNLPEMEADAFYDEFQLLTPAPEGFLPTEGWLVSAHTTELHMTFSASFRPEQSNTFTQRPQTSGAWRRDPVDPHQCTRPPKW